MTYRRDIDGLRAVAVLAVVVYHARFNVGESDLLAGGFIGVDVFFVISGYLITALIARELESGSFSIKRFYERRVRRIMPALLCLLVVAVPTAHLLLEPRAFDEFSGSVPAALLFYANLFFYSQDSYAAEPSQLKPLLHTWSLSVEEQFYLVFPPLMMLLWRIDRRLRTAALTSLFVLSFSVALHLASRSSDANFFLAPSRSWELLAGGALALYGHKARAIVPTGASWIPSVGLLAIFWSFVTFDESTSHPGLMTLVPVTGSIAVIGFAHDRSWATRILSTSGLVGVGLISYSLYLWHFTIFAFGRVAAEGDVSQFDMFIWIAASFAVATVSWRYVERPFRQPGRLRTRSVVAVVASVSLIVGGVAVAGAVGEPEEEYSRIPAELQGSFATWEDPYAGQAACVDQDDFMSMESWCRLGASGGDIDFLVVGDSHAHALAAVFDAGARVAGTTGLLVSRSGCPVLVGLEPARGASLSRDCLDLANLVPETVHRKRISQVFLASRWNYYICGDPQPDCGFTQNVRYGDSPFSRSTTTRLRYLEQALDETFGALRDAGTSVHVVNQVPHQLHDPRAVYDASFSAGAPHVLVEMSVSYTGHTDFTGRTREVINSAVKAYPDVEILDPSEVLCRSATCLMGTISGSWYSDDDHLSIGAAEVLTEWAAEALR